jgi:LacI family transcriptional regulator
MARKYASLKEVASVAGVSFQTASKVLNGGEVRVSPATADRIWEAARTLGYSPNTVARSLVQQSTATIGVVAGALNDPALTEMMVGAERAARQHGYAVLMSHVSETDNNGPEAVRTLIERRVDGIVVAAPQVEESTEVAELLRQHQLTVSLQHVPGGGVPLVGSNHREVGRLATSHLVAAGRTKVATVTGPFRRRVVRSRLRAFEETLRSHDIEVNEDLVVESDWTPDGGAAATELLLQSEPDLNAIFVHSDLMAVGVLGALAAAGRRVPDDVAVVSCDDLAFAAHLLPALTTVRLPLAESGAAAVELLLNPTERSTAGEPVILPVELVVRDSCGQRQPAAPNARSAPRRGPTAADRAPSRQSTQTGSAAGRSQAPTERKHP